MRVMYVLAVLQGVFFGLTGATMARRLTGVALVVLMLLESQTPWLLGGRRFQSAAFLSVAIVVNFAAHLFASTAPFSLRPLQAAIVIGYIALACAAVAQFLQYQARRLAQLLIATVAVAMIIGELALERSWGGVVDGRVVWDGSPVPEMHMMNQPSSDQILRTQYPDDPRDYFEDVDALRASWTLDVHNPESRARLEFPPETPKAIQVVIDRIADTTWWGVQLNQSPLRFDRDRRYALRFRARASRRRSISVAVSQGHPPWEGLGFGKVIDLDTTWKQFEESISVQRDDSLGRLHFDLGREGATVQLADVSLRRADGSIVAAFPSTRPAVRYRFNVLGCRGAPITGLDPGAARILILGDSYALGIGVHEPDTFAAQLTSLLPAHGGYTGRVSVLNCGAVGFGPSEASLRYQRLASAVRPDIVLLAFGRLAERTWSQEQEAARRSNRTKFRYLLRTLTLLGPRRTPPGAAVAEFNDSLVRVAKEAERAGSRVAVVLFDHPEAAGWVGVEGQIAEGLRSRQVNVVDLGASLQRASPRWRDMRVHPTFDDRAGPMAHGIAATEVARFILAAGWLAPGPS